MRRRALLLFALLLLASRARATLLVPMRDEDLVAISDLVVTGVVGDITTVRLPGTRIVTRITVSVERALKGDPGGASVVVTEPGGSVDGLAAVVGGAPEFTRGERVLVFLRLRPDGSLRTTALALGKYRLDDAGAARRDVPVPDVRPAAAFAARVAALARGQRGAAADGRRGVGSAPPEVGRTIAAFTFGKTPGGLPARWFEADCGMPVPFSQANVETGYPPEASDGTVTDALAAWSGVAGASLALARGPATVPAESILSKTYDGRNVIQFDDPFSEVRDFVQCSGVLAQGGFISGTDRRFGFRTTVDGRHFGRILEGDLTVNPGLAACDLDATALAEIVAHELGHTIGLGHSSEDPTEPDPTKRDALMYFLLHNDGRGASLRADDVAGVQALYPTSRVATDAAGRAACDLGLGVIGMSCFNRRLPAAPIALVRTARAKAKKAAATTDPAKRTLLLTRARDLVATAQRKAQPVRGACGDQMRARLATLAAGLDTALGSP